MKRVVCLFMLVLLSVTISIPLTASDIEDNVKYYNSDNGSLYLQPLADAFGAALNSGLYHDGKVEKFGLHLTFEVRVMGAIISDDQTTFTSVQEESMPAGKSIPTIFGSKDEVTVEGLDFNPKGLYDYKVLPIPVPQLSIGSFAGTEINLRFFTTSVSDEIGDLKIFGFGVRHSLSQYILLFPVDVALSYFQQSFEIGNIVEAKARYIGIQASKKFSIMTLYGGFGMQSSSLDIQYTYEGSTETSEISFDLDGKSRSCLTLGLGLDLTYFKLHADYNIASQQVFSLGVGFGI
ncbi:hypothetical protein JW979_15635 [bacterium]|nr:hypothetical protein [candidate division CSSED10-310 bacterium]